MVVDISTNGSKRLPRPRNIRAAAGFVDYGFRIQQAAGLIVRAPAGRAAGGAQIRVHIR